MSKFPRTLYVVIDPDSKDTIADENPEALGYAEDTQPMARYVLVGTGEVINQTRYVERAPQINEAQDLASLGQAANSPLNPYATK
jgi:hypothetical protein